MINFVISRNLDGTGHHLFLLRRFREYLDPEVPFQLTTLSSNKPYVERQIHELDHIKTRFFGSSSKQFFIKALISPKIILGERVESKDLIIHDDVNWKDLIFYSIFAIRLFLFGQARSVGQIKLVFRYTFSSLNKKIFYLIMLKFVSGLGCKITSDSFEVLSFWKLSKGKKFASIPVNEEGLFPIIPSVIVIGASIRRRDEGGDIQIGVPGQLRPDKGLFDIIKLTEKDLQDIELRVNLPEQYKVVNKKVVDFGTFDSDLYYIQALSELDYQLFWFDVQRYKHATSSTFFEALVVGVIPLTRRGTFCAKILERSGLGDLVFENITEALTFARQRAKMEVLSSPEYQRLRSTIETKFSNENIAIVARSLVK